MTRNDGCLSVKMQELLEYASHQCVIIAARMVCAAYGSCKKRVTAEQSLLRSFIKAHSSFGVPGSFDDLEAQFSYIHHVSVGIDQANGVLTAEVSVCAYDRIPGGTVSQNIDRGLSIENQRGESFWDGGQGGGTMTGGAVYHCRYVPVEPDDEYVTLFYDGFGEHIQCRVPLPKEGTP